MNQHISAYTEKRHGIRGVAQNGFKGLKKALDNVKTQDLGEVGDLLSGVVSELKSFDAEEERGVFGFFKKSANKITAMKAKYAKAETNIN